MSIYSNYSIRLANFTSTQQIISNSLSTVKSHINRPLSQELLSNCFEQLTYVSKKITELEKIHYPWLLRSIQLISMDGNFTQEKASLVRTPLLLRMGLTPEQCPPAHEVKKGLLEEHSEMKLDMGKMRGEVERLKLTIEDKLAQLPPSKNMIQRVTSWLLG